MAHGDNLGIAHATAEMLEVSRLIVQDTLDDLISSLVKALSFGPNLERV